MNSIKMKLKKEYHVNLLLFTPLTSNGVNVVFSDKKNTKTWKDLFISLKHQKVYKKKKKINCFKQMTFFAQKLHYIIFFFFFLVQFLFFSIPLFLLMRHLVVTFRPYPVKRFQHLVELQNLVEYHNVGWTKKRTDEQKKKIKWKKRFFFISVFNGI